MLNKALLSVEVARFIRNNLKKDLPALILKGSPFNNISIQELAIQIKGTRVAEKKFPEFFKTPGLLYPPQLNLEQTSSELTARYKASLVGGTTGIDLTGGLGIDSYFLSKNFQSFRYCELDPELSEIAAHNFEVLKAKNISVHNGDALKWLKNSEEIFSWIYADPARRDDHGGKVFKFEDCEPNIPANLNLLFSRTNRLLIKSSPVLDLTAGINELSFVKEVHIIAVKNEVKELLWLMEKDHTGDIILKTVNFEKNAVQEFSAVWGSNIQADDFTEPQTYLYEPNAAIMKSGLFNALAEKTGTKKLHQHSHLYSSESLKDFQGRKFEIIDIKDYKPSILKKYLKNKKANVSTRNFPETVASIRKKFKIKEGGNDYIFFTTNRENQKILIFCRKV